MLRARALAIVVLLAHGAQAFVGDARVSLKASDVLWSGGAGGGAGGGAARHGSSWLETGSRAGGARASAPPLAAVQRARSDAQPQRAPGAAAAPGPDGGGAFTCVPYDPATQALQANATAIRRLVLQTPLRLPGGFAAVSQPSAADVIAPLAERFGIPAGTLRPAGGGDDRTDELGLRHIRLEQVQPYMGELFG
ncbi:MAG: hypothetical protein J3K34DRAFT_289032 [Monoraphidium minutum]|nr:MAG: hypothetical protein J3K34DRAFT_289032 [Monoraphidium minutum]